MGGKAKQTRKSRQKEERINGKKQEEGGLEGAQHQRERRAAVNRAQHTHKVGEASEKFPCVHPAPAQPYQSRAPWHHQQSQQLWKAQVSGARLSPTRRPRREPWDQGQFQQALPPSLPDPHWWATGASWRGWWSLGSRLAAEFPGLASWVPSYPPEDLRVGSNGAKLCRSRGKVTS